MISDYLEKAKEIRDLVKLHGIVFKAKPSLKRALQAFCYECNGFERVDCESRSCPFYMYNKYSKLPPKLWWLYPSRLWRTFRDKKVYYKNSITKKHR